MATTLEPADATVALGNLRFSFAFNGEQNCGRASSGQVSLVLLRRRALLPPSRLVFATAAGASRTGYCQRHWLVGRQCQPWCRQLGTAATTRAQQCGWGLRQRALYILATPLLPLLPLRRLGQSLTHLQCTGRGHLLGSLLLPWLLAMLAGALGEMLGYLLGPLPAIGRRRLEPELHRRSHLNPARPQGAVLTGAETARL